MKRIICMAGFVGALLHIGCQPGKEESSVADRQTISGVAADTAIVRGTACAIDIANIHFDKSVNGADTLVVVQQDGWLQFSVGAKKDYFSDPDGKLSNNTAPILLSKINNTRPFTLLAKVTPRFTREGLYNAGVLYIYASDRLYQKLCFEQDEHGDHRVVSVKTTGTSDDNNHDRVESPFVYLKITSDTKTVGNYYSLDNKTWKLARLYKNEYPAAVWVGISAQCPVDTGTVSYFEQLKLEEKSVADFRLGN